MRSHTDTQIARALQDLDAADHSLGEAQRARAARTREEIVASGPVEPTRTSPPHRAPRRRATRPLLVGGVLAAVAAVAAVVAGPVLVRGDEAFASWSPTPVELRGAARAAAVEACLALQSEETAGLGVEPAAEPVTLVAEERGGWTYVLFRVAGLSQPELEGSCLMPAYLVRNPEPGAGGFFGGLSGADDTAGPTRGRTAVREDEYGVGSVGDDMFARVEGQAGADVARIEVVTPGGLKVEASVDEGHWAAWWPVDNDDLGATEMLTYEVTLRDGTVTD